MTSRALQLPQPTSNLFLYSAFPDITAQDISELRLLATQTIGWNASRYRFPSGFPGSLSYAHNRLYGARQQTHQHPFLPELGLKVDVWSNPIINEVKMVRVSKIPTSKVFLNRKKRKPQ